MHVAEAAVAAAAVIDYCFVVVDVVVVDVVAAAVAAVIGPFLSKNKGNFHKSKGHEIYS